MKKLYIKCICFSSLWQKHNCDTECFVKTRSTHPEVFCEKGVLRPEKKRLQPWHFIEKETLAQHICFPVNFAKFVRTFFLQNTSGGCFWKTFSFYLKRLFLRLRRFRFFRIQKFLLSKALVDGWFWFFLSFSWIFTKAIQILKRQSEEMSW